MQDVHLLHAEPFEAGIEGGGDGGSDIGQVRGPEPDLGANDRVLRLQRLEYAAEVLLGLPVAVQGRRIEVVDARIQRLGDRALLVGRRAAYHQSAHRSASEAQHRSLHACAAEYARFHGRSRVLCRVPTLRRFALTSAISCIARSSVPFPESACNASHRRHVRHVVRAHPRPPRCARAGHPGAYLRQGRKVPRWRPRGSAARRRGRLYVAHVPPQRRRLPRPGIRPRARTANRSASCRRSMPGSIIPSTRSSRPRARASATAAPRAWRSPSTSWPRCWACSSRSTGSAACRPRRQWEITPFRELSQTIWLIIGFGPIGQEIAKRVKAFGAGTLVVRRTAQASPLADEVGTTADLGRLLPKADVIVLACPLNDETRGMAGKQFFAAVKDSAAARQYRPRRPDRRCRAAGRARRGQACDGDPRCLPPGAAAGRPRVLVASARAPDLAHVVLGQRRPLALGPAVPRQHRALRERPTPGPRG